MCIGASHRLSLVPNAIVPASSATKQIQAGVPYYFWVLESSR